MNNRGIFGLPGDAIAGLENPSPVKPGSKENYHLNMLLHSLLSAGLIVVARGLQPREGGANE